MRKVLKAKALRGYPLELTFDDGVRATVDLSDRVGKGVFALSNAPRVFENVLVEPTGEAAWGTE